MTSDFTSSPYPDLNLLPGVELQRAAMGISSLMIAEGEIPPNFPTPLWEQQAARYREYWSWFIGLKLEAEKGTTAKGDKVLKFPLQINPIRNFSRKHNALLFGETPERPQALVKTVMHPKPSLSGVKPTKQKKTDAQFYGNIINEVWKSSNGRAIQYENGLMSQFLGGCFFQVEYQPWRKDLLIPLRINNIVPDYILPIWTTDDPWSLLECWIVYRIQSKIAQEEFGIKPVEAPYVTYVEHWTRQNYSIWINNQPLTASYRIPGADKPFIVNYDKRPNPFGFVPIVYIPRFREGNFYGSSLVPDLSGLALEFNGRFADYGTIVQRTAHRRWIGRNISGTVRLKSFDNGEYYSDLGMENPSIKHQPDLWPENPPNLGAYVKENLDLLWAQLLREGNLTDVHFGEDEGSQRSGETLKARFWPSTVSGKSQRLFWECGLNQIGLYILNMLSLLGIKVEDKAIPLHINREFDMQQDWPPMVARDREQLMNEITTLRTSDPEKGRLPGISLRRSLEIQGDVQDEDEEYDAIWQEQKDILDLQMESQKKLLDAQAENQAASADKQVEGQIAVNQHSFDNQPKKEPADKS